MAQSLSTSQDLLDIATRIAISASQPRPRGRQSTQEPVVDSTTINNLLAYMQSRKSIKELLAYILRQTGREEIDRNTSKLLLSTLKNFKESDDDINKALELLGYVKWIYETISGLNIDASRLKNISTFQQLVEELVKMM
ncbi:hypothetical protein EWF20_00705 [Sulfolobus sp. S-194]|uniref:hypothetical protein n=1 Tax=Sulfolobus sp. S-194 TaxID=2512240 RepID=UPI0014370A0C|nr:hypothetical protein [Sulfolobus sp. S-194]QIW22825.1 hypothetical protein EWF20_00705 [Sulfolobus sp. S-194]